MLFLAELKLLNCPVVIQTLFWRVLQYNPHWHQARIFATRMEEDFNENVMSEEENEIDERNTFDSNLTNYLGYERKKLSLKAGEPLHLMNIDVAASIERKYMNMTVEDEDGGRKHVETIMKLPLIQIYSTTEAGNSVCVNVRDFVPYFFARYPNDYPEPTEGNLDVLRFHLNKRMNEPYDIITKIIIVEAMDLLNYRPDSALQSERYIRIELISQAYVPGLRKVFEDGEVINNRCLPRQTYESNIPYLLRFMIDKEIVGMGWFRVNAGYKIVPDNEKMTRCQLEIQTNVHNITALACEGRWAKIAPQRVLSFDIECAAEKGFPNAEVDKIIQIACVCKSTDKDVEDYKVVFVLGGASPISGVHTKNEYKQQEMLEDFQKLVLTYDPEFIVGYNMVNFDLKYILERAKALGMKKYGFFGRNLRQLSKVTSGRFNSKVMGMRETFEVNTDGRIQMDMLIHMHKEHKLSSYRLNNVSFQFLGDQKEDVHHSEITKLYKESMDGRKRLAIYCLKDAQLPLRLMEKLCCLYNYCEMARVTGVPVSFLISRGQQIKVVSQILRKARKRKFIMPTIRSRGKGGQIGFEGAFVLDPKPGFYQQPIATLDFASLYPSIMMAHNLCYTTLLLKNNIDQYGFTEQDITVTPQKHYFIKSTKREGLLPEILRELIGARKKAKKELAETTDPQMQKVLDGRQLALKISANSVYGFTGATVGQLPCLAISSSVTSFGRQMIEKTRSLVIEKFNADVIYGDTDSVMVKFPLKQGQSKTEQIVEAMNYGREAAALISKQFISPIKLEFEKVYCPYLLMSKKRYAGVYWTRPDKYDKIDKKGIQAVRRDNCLLIREMLETVLETVLAEGNKQKAIKYIQETIRDLLQNKIDISKLVISKAISKHTDDDDGKKNNPEDDKNNKKSYKSKQAHTELAEKMKKRDENIEINIGDRIPYVMINGSKWSKNYQNAEDPKKVLEEDLSIDYDYYINKQIKPPLERLLKNTHIVQNFDALFSGEHTRVRYAPKVNEKSALGAFLEKKQTCMSCKRVSASAICADCKDKTTEIYLKKKEEYEELHEEKCKLMTECHNCQRFVTDEVICQNFDCPIFYRRIKVDKEIIEKEKNIERFDTLAW